MKVTSETLPEKYEWDYGDGLSATSTEPTLSHTYPLPASGSKTYTINVKAVGPEDCEDNKTRKLLSPPPMLHHRLHPMAGLLKPVLICY
ncbi:MAG: hypothetical protein E2O76_11660 [Caldithrix sp.]|nr:MAG: hypothetical protein E2O76_11660 [Caldithrix sp.]